MTWRSEFGSEWKVPASVLALVRDGTASDASYRNDAAPRFSASNGEREVNLWVDHPSPAKRGMDGHRYLVDNGGGHTVWYDGDSVADAVVTFKQQATKLRAKKSARKATTRRARAK